MDSAKIAFRPVVASDLPVLREWMARPHWQEWWGKPDEEIGFIQDMLEGRDSTLPFLILIDGQAAGYIQVWFIADNRREPWLSRAPWLLELEDRAVGVDISLAEGSQLGKGLGSAAVSSFVKMLRDQGYDAIWIDPDPENHRAIRAYEKAGFRAHPAYQGRYPDCLLMRHELTQQA